MAPRQARAPFLRDSLRTLRDAALGSALTGGLTVPPLPLRQRLFGAPRLDEVVAGRQVLVTGASSGIGRAVALKLAAAGATVVLVARSADALRELQHEIESRGGRARAYPADLSSAASVHALLARLAGDALHIDFLINNAGRSIRRPIEDAYERVHDYERTMAINYFGSLRLILGLLPGMRSRGAGHIVNVSSAGVQIATPLFSAYVASKAALDAFARVAAAETRHDGIRFTTVHMPLVRTPMIAPTAAYRGMPALTPETAADLVLRPLATGERQIGTRLSRLLSVGHALAPELLERLLSFALRATAERLPAADAADLPPTRERALDARERNDDEERLVRVLSGRPVALLGSC